MSAMNTCATSVVVSSAHILPAIAIAFVAGTLLLVSILRNTGTDNFIESVAMSWDQVWQSQAQAGWCRCSREAQCYILWNLSMFKNALMVNLNVKLQAVDSESEVLRVRISAAN